MEKTVNQIVMEEFAYLLPPTKQELIEEQLEKKEDNGEERNQ